MPAPNLDFSPDGKTLAIAVWEREGGYGKHKIAFWDWPRGKKERFQFYLPGLRDSHRLRFNPKQSTLAVITCRAETQSVSIYELPSKKVAWEIECPGKPWAVEWSPDGKLLAVVVHNLHLLFDVHLQAELGRVPLEFACAVAFSPDGRLLALGSAGKGGVWEIAKLTG